MIPLNVSFGVFAFLPMGWLFMAFVILGEAFLMSWYLTGKKFDKKIFRTAALSNIVSGAVGIITTLALNGGWWLVVWFPWVSKHEVDIHDSQGLWGLIVYYAVALVLSVLIELLVNHLMLRKQYPFKKTLHAKLTTPYETLPGFDGRAVSYTGGGGSVGSASMLCRAFFPLKCSYRSIFGTHASVFSRFLLAPVHALDLYKHLMTCRTKQAHN